MNLWFVYDPDDTGFQFFETELEAKEEFGKAFGFEQEHAYNDGWGEGVFDLCWGQVTQRIQETERRKGESGEQFDEYIVYAPRPV